MQSKQPKLMVHSQPTLTPILTIKYPTVSASTVPLCRDDEPALKAMDRLVGDGDSDDESSPSFPTSTAGGDGAGTSSVLISRGAGGGGLGFGLACGASSEAAAAARAARNARVLALGGRPLPGDLPVPPALGDLVALPFGDLGDFLFGEVARGDLDLGRPTFPLGFGMTAGGGGAGAGAGSGFSTAGFTSSTGASGNSGNGGGDASRSGVPNRGFIGSGDLSLAGE